MFGGVGGGTPQYMPPELIEGVGAAVPRDRAESSGSQGSSGSGSLGGNHSISSQRSYQSSDEENPNTGSRTTSTDFESGRGMHTLDLNVDGQREKMKADVYAFGIILWELITCEPVCVCDLSFPFLSFFLSFFLPFLSRIIIIELTSYNCVCCFPRNHRYPDCRSVWEILTQVLGSQLRPPLPPQSVCPREISALMQECWRADPQLRPTFDEIQKKIVQCQRKYT